MKKFLLVIVISLSSVLAQNYKKVEIYINQPADIQSLYGSGMQFDHPILTKNSSFIAVLSENDFSVLKQTGYRYKVLVDDMQKYFETQPKLTDYEKQSFIDESSSLYGVTGMGYGSMGGYYTMSEVWQKLDSMFIRFPNLITQKFSIGTTYEGRPIYAVKISDNPNVSENEPALLYTGLHHAREPQGMTCVLYFMYYLLENYGTDPEATYLVNNREFYFVPIVNVDGYEYNRSTNPSGGGYWRKNRKLNSDGSRGIDLNRNYGPYTYWNSSNGGSSTYPSDDTYRGTAPFSEAETAALRDFIAAKNIKCALNYHSYGNYLIYPYGALSHETPDSTIFREFSSDMAAYNHYFAGLDLEAVGYSTRGNSDDYMYDGDVPLNGGKIFAMTPEVGDDFWPTQAEIFPLAQENLRPNLYLAWVAGESVVMTNANPDRQYINPGDLVSIQPYFKNKGVSNAANINFTLTSLTDNVLVNNGTASIPDLPARTEIMLPQPLSFQVGTGVQVETSVKLLLTKNINGNAAGKDTISFIVGVPTYIFMDTTSTLSTYWTAAGTSGSQIWEPTTTSFHSAPNSYTDSRTGNYVSNATVTLTLNNNISLTNYSSPRLSFWTRYAFETQWDCGVVQISTNNGSTWLPLQGIYSIGASGSGRQVPAGIPVYDGTRSQWSKEEIDLSSFSGQQVKLRFELRSDVSLNYDGWYLDDIGIFYYGIVPVEFTSFAASVVKNKVILNWSTATELNNRCFEIQRAPATSLISEIRDWQSVGYVNGSGTTTQRQNYSFADVNPIAGKSYYRLKQHDLNGSFTYSNPVEADFTGIIDYSLNQNYPNPFNPSSTISFSIPEKGMVSLKIYDMLGSEAGVLINEEKEAGTYSVDFNSADYNLGSGVYFYTLKSGSFSQTRKMVILK